MTDDYTKKFNLNAMRDKLKEDYSWTAVSQILQDDAVAEEIGFAGKNLENGHFANEDLRGANFSVSNLTNVDFSGADLRNVDLSGANLTDANLSGADLSGAILSGAVLARTNFTGAKLKGVKLTEAYLEDAILIDAELDELTIEEHQELVEYMAKYYPHKLNLSKLNLTLLDMKQIDLSKVSLRGVDFTGVDFTGVNILGLDLSECIITPEQIAQALGRVPGKDELAKLLAPKKKESKGGSRFDASEIFLDDGRDWGVWDLAGDQGISIESLLKVGKKVFRHGAAKPKVKDEEALNQIKSNHEQKAKNHDVELRRVIEERKRKELEARMAMKKEFQDEMSKTNAPEKPREAPKKEIDLIAVKEQGRGRS